MRILLFGFFILLANFGNSQNYDYIMELEKVKYFVEYFRSSQSRECNLIYEVIWSKEDEFPSIKEEYTSFLNASKEIDEELQQAIINRTDTLYKYLYSNNCSVLAEDVFKCRKYLKMCFNKLTSKRIVDLTYVIENFWSEDRSMETLLEAGKKGVELMDDCGALIEYFNDNGYSIVLDNMQKAIILESCNE